MFKKKVLALLIAVCLVFLCIGCSGSSTPEGDETSSTGKIKDTLVAAIRADPENLDPHNNANWPCFIVEEVIFDRLVQMDENGKIQPMLATSWEIIDDVTVRFNLRDDVYWHDGSKFTAEDVRYTIARAVDMKGSITMMAAFDGPGTKVVDDYTVDIKTKYPFGPLFRYLVSSRGNIVCAAHVEKVGVEAHGRNPMGTGPFKFVSWNSGDRINLEKNDEYWGELPNFDKMVFRVIPEASSRALEVESGAVDVALHIDEADVARLKESSDVNLVSGPSYTTHQINFNIYKNEWLQDPRVRKALFVAVDKPALVKAVYGDTAGPSTSAFSHMLPYHTPADKNSYDPELAKQLLDEAGFDYNTKIVINVQNDAVLIKDAEVLQNMWGQIGLDVAVEISDQSAFSAILASRDFMMNMATNSCTSGDPDHQLFDWKTNKHGIILNEEYEPISDEAAEIYDLIMSSRASLDDAVRTERYAKLQDIMCNEYYGMFMLADVNAIYCIGNDVQDFYCSPAYMPNLARVNFAN